MSKDTDDQQASAGEEESRLPAGTVDRSGRNSINIYASVDGVRRRQRWPAAAEVILIEWLEKENNYSRFEDLGCQRWPVDGQIKLNSKQTICEEAVIFLKSRGINRTAPQIRTKVRNLVKSWELADEEMQASAAVASGFSMDADLSTMIDNATKAEIYRICRHWDILDPVLRPVLSVHPNTDDEVGNLVTTSTEPTHTPRKLNSLKALNKDTQKKSLPNKAKHSPGIIFKIKQKSNPKSSAKPSDAPMRLLIPRSSLELWCAVCEIFMDGPCVLHTKSIKDEIFQRRAHATLPNELIISNADENLPNDKRVLTNVDILQPTVFGPLIGTLVDAKEDLLSDVKFVLTVSEFGVAEARYFCLNSDDDCNWMKYVRLVKQPSEANLIVFQQQGSVYFSTFKPVRASEELVVIYSTHYARTVEEATTATAVNKVPARSSGPSRTTTYRQPSPPLIEPQSVLNLLSNIPALPNFLPGEEEVDFPLDADFLPPELAAAVSAADDYEGYWTPAKRRKTEKPVLRRSPRKTDKLDAVVTEPTSDAEFRSTVPEPIYDSGSDWLPEDITKKKDRLQRPLVKPQKRMRIRIPKEERALLNVQRAAAKGELLDYETELDKLEQESVAKKERYRAGKYGEFIPVPVTLEMLQNDPVDRLRTWQEIMSIERLIRDLKFEELSEEKAVMFAAAKECMEREKTKQATKKKGGRPKAKGKKRKLEVVEGEENAVKKLRVKRNMREKCRVRAKCRAGKFSMHYRYATFSCDQCDVVYREQGLLDIHGICHGKDLESPPSLTCPSCDLVCESVDQLLLHIKKHQRRCKGLTKVTEFKCEICKQCYDSNAFLERHMIRVHPPGGKEAQTFDEAKYPCPVCNKECLTLPGLASHSRVHKGKFAECIICLEHTRSSKELQLHAIEKHLVDGVFHCRLCERTYAEYNILKNHVKHFHRPANLSCDKCSKMVKSQEMLDRHYLCHQNVFPFECQTCGRKFKRKKNYKDHVEKLHKADRVYKMKERSEKIANAFAKAVVCEYCTRQYQNRKRLLIHQREKHLELLPHELRIGNMAEDASSRSSEESDEDYKAL